MSDVDRALGNRLLWVRVEEYRQRRQVLEDLIAETLLNAEAGRRGVALAVLLEREVDRKVRPVTEEECRAAYERSRANLGSMSEADALRSIGDALRRQRVADRRQEFVEELKRGAKPAITLEPPRIAVDPGPATAGRGLPIAPVTIVEFSDFQCPYCQQMSATLGQIEAKYGVRVRRVVRHLPLPMHKDASMAAEAAVCAERQGKFWEMHDRLFAHQAALSAADLKRDAAVLGLDREAFDACLDSGAARSVWQKDRADAEAYGVNGTPALFVNGRPVFGIVPLSELAGVIDEELARASRANPGRQ